MVNASASLYRDAISTTILMHIYKFSFYMCNVVKIVNLLDEFYLVYSLSNEVSEYILEPVNKFAIMPVSQAILSPLLH